MNKKYIIPVLLLLAACTSEETINNLPETQSTDTAVSFSASIGGSNPSRADGEEDDEYLHKHFINEGEDGRQSRIRVVNTVNYSVPDFTDPTQYKEYAYTGNGTETWESNEANFTPWQEGGGFNWNEIRPTAASFVFEAACYPNSYEPFETVPTDQSQNIADFLKADLLLAHHRQDLNARYDLVKLRFYHAFAMIRVKIKLPVTGPQIKGGFPSHAINEVRLKNMQAGYDIDYTSTIDNNGLRPVSASGDKITEGIKMYPLTYAQSSTDGNTTTESYTYCGIVPEQTIEEGSTLVSFSINTYPGTQNGNNEWDDAEAQEYIFVRRNQNIRIRQAYITDLQLGIEVEVPETILLKAEVQPWGERYTEMPLQPDADEEEDSAQP